MLLILLGCLAIQLVYPLVTIPLRVSSDYGEGWNAYWAQRVVDGAPLYTDWRSPITDNYPPLSFYVVGAGGWLIGDQIIAGRLISLFSLLACAGMVAVVSARLGASRAWAVAAGLSLLLYVASFAWRYVASDDPQWLAAAVSLAALVLLVGRDDITPSPRRLIGACALLVVSGLIKHNQLALPIAITLWLAGRDRWGLVIWLASGALMIGACLAVLHVGFGPLLFDQVLNHYRTFQFRYWLASLETLSGLMPEMGLAVMLAAAQRRRDADARITLMLLFGGAALALGIMERFGTGVSVNAHFDTALACMILGGVALGRDGALSDRQRRVMSAPALLPLALATLVMLPHNVQRTAHIARTDARWHRAIALLHDERGVVACELPALCYWAGRPFNLDFYNYGQKLRTTGDPIDLRDRLAQRRYAALAVVHDRRFAAGDGRLPDAYNRAIARGYRAVLALPDYTYILLRKPDQSI